MYFNYVCLVTIVNLAAVVSLSLSKTPFQQCPSILFTKTLRQAQRNNEPSIVSLATDVSLSLSKTLSYNTILQQETASTSSA
jgi:hypothetical protein